MQLVNLKAIIIPDNRIRREFDPMYMLGLQTSIQDKGLLHPVVLRNDGVTLLAGEQRLRALTELHRQDKAFKCMGAYVARDMIPCTLVAELSEFQLMEAEYEENAIRRDLTLPERVDAIAKLHALRTSQKAAVGKAQTLFDTAKEIFGHAVKAGSPSKSIANAIFLAKHMNDPDVRAAKSEKEAVNIARKKITDGLMQTAAEQFRSSNVITPHTALMGSVLDLTFDQPFDGIIVDPPFGINAHKMAPLSGSNAATEHEYDDTFETASVIWQHIFTQIPVKPQAALYMFYDLRHHELLHELATQGGWTVWPTPLIGIKRSGGMLGDSAHGPRKAYECVLYAYRGDKRVTGVYFDWFDMGQADTKIHPANKSVPAYFDLLKRSFTPGMSVIDPCMGGGTIFPAANKLALKATGVEPSKTYYGTAISRITAKE